MLLRNNKLQEKVRKSSNFLKQLFSKFTDQCILWNVYYTVAGNIYLSYLRSHTNLYWPLAIYTTSTRSRTPTYLPTYLPTSYQGRPTRDYLPTYLPTRRLTGVRRSICLHEEPLRHRQVQKP